MYFTQLSFREKECLQLLARGYRTKNVAYELDITIDTVNYHLKNSRGKLEAKTLSHAIAIAVKYQQIVV